MKLLGRALFSLWAVFWGVFMVVLPSLLYVAVAVFYRNVRWMDFCQSLHARLLLPLVGVRVTVEGREHLDPARNAIVLANHRSLLDIPTMVGAIPRLRFVAKRELGRIPIFGWALLLSEHVLIDRKNRSSAVEALQEMAEVFGTGRNVMVFAEGTRARGERLLPLKKGGFHLAIDTGLPLLPVSIEGNQHTLPKGSLLLRPGRVRVVIHPLIEVAGKGRRDIPDLMAEVRGVLLSGLPGARALEDGGSKPRDFGTDKSSGDDRRSPGAGD